MSADLRILIVSVYFSIYMILLRWILYIYKEGDKIQKSSLLSKINVYIYIYIYIYIGFPLILSEKTKFGTSGILIDCD